MFMGFIYCDLQITIIGRFSRRGGGLEVRGSVTKTKETRWQVVGSIFRTARI